MEQAVRRELKEETGCDVTRLFQFHTFSRPGRDPRGWTVSTAFVACVHPDEVKPKGGDDAAEVRWFSLKEIPAMAFDHQEILETALHEVRKGRFEDALFEVLATKV